MWVHFEYCDGSNPYITISNRRLWGMICKYHVVQVAEKAFFIIGRRERNGKLTYRDYKAILHSFAIEWSRNFNRLEYSYEDLADWAAFFNEYGYKYGLLAEFRENAVA